MPARGARLIGEIAFCGFLVFIGGMALFGVQGLRKSPFDYLGSADVPRVLGWLVIGLSLSVMVKLIFASRQDVRNEPELEHDDAPKQEEGGPRRVRQVAIVGGLAFAYVLSIIWMVLPYSVSTTLFLICSMAVLAPRALRNWRLILPVSVLIGAGGEYVFVHLLVLPFPGF